MFWIRTICCLSIVLIHSISESKSRSSNVLLEDSLIFNGLSMIQVLLMFATPTFIMISEFIISQAYKDILPKNFIKKRMKILFLPYLFMSIIYSFINMEVYTIKDSVINLIYGVLFGGTTVYFILIIFQFYVLHWLFHNYLAKFNPWKVLIISFIINILYVFFFNYTDEPNNLLGQYIWSRGFYMVFIAWIFYFVLGYYTGRYYKEVKEYLNKNIIYIIIFYIGCITIIIFNRHNALLGISSKSYDIIAYTGTLALHEYIHNFL